MKTIIKNVMIFDGTKPEKAKDIVFAENILDDLSADGSTEIIDGTGCTILPGLIDSHIHLNSIDNLKQAALYGVTTMLDMMTDDAALVDSLRHQKGLPDIQSCYQPVISEPGQMLIASLGQVSSFVNTPKEAREHIKTQLEKGADYVKLILENPPLVTQMLSEDIVAETVRYSHEMGKKVFAHTTSVQAYQLAAEHGVEVLNHIPKETALPQEIISEIKEKDLTVIPTMLMQQGMVKAIHRMMPGRPADYSIVEKTFYRMYKAGIRIIAGTDSNMTNRMNFIPHGKAMHEELKLMVKAGMTPEEVLKSATSIPAETFNLKDRGNIKPGFRADLLLVRGNPAENINDIDHIEKIWINGMPVQLTA